MFSGIICDIHYNGVISFNQFREAYFSAGARHSSLRVRLFAGLMSQRRVHSGIQSNSNIATRQINLLFVNLSRATTQMCRDRAIYWRAYDFPLYAINLK